MADKRRNTEQFKLRPPSALLEELRDLAPKVGYATANELAVDLLSLGLEVVQTGKPPALLRELRGRLGLPVADEAQLQQLVASLASTLGDLGTRMERVEAAAGLKRGRGK